MSPARAFQRPFAATPTVAGDPSRATPGANAGGTSAGALRRLRVLGIAAPVLFILGVQVARPLLTATTPWAEVALDVATAVAVIVFGLVMFRLLDRWYGETLRANRELAVRDAVATALRDAKTTPDAVASAAARSVRDATGATRVLLDMPDVGRWDAFGRLEPVDPTSDTDASGSMGSMGAADVEELLFEGEEGLPVTAFTVPLLAAATRVGALRVWLPARIERTPNADGGVETRAATLSAATIDAIGQQIGSALHRAVLAAELHGALRDQQAVSRTLLRITRGSPLEASLVAVVAAAAERTGADVAGLRLDAAGVPALHPDPGIATLCVTARGVAPCPGPRSSCPHRPHPPALRTAPIAGTRGEIGELWVAADAADRPVLADLAELTAVALEHARLLEDERSAAAVREREWIAREMHDSLAQVLGVLHLRLRALEALLGSVDVEDSQRELADLADLAHDAFIDVRESILGLRENVERDRSFVDALRGYVAKYERQSGITARVVVLPGADGGGADDADAIALTPAAEVQMLRVVQEALTNVRKHASARTATVLLGAEDGQVFVEVVDDGTGFAVEGAGRFDSFGLSSMRERCELVGGTLHLESAPGRGTRVAASLPAAGRDPARTATTYPTGAHQ